jgi:hypothetical protein
MRLVYAQLSVRSCHKLRILRLGYVIMATWRKIFLEYHPLVWSPCSQQLSAGRIQSMLSYSSLVNKGKIKVYKAIPVTGRGGL